MGRKRGVHGKPWYRLDRDQWFVTIDGKKQPLLNAKDHPIRGKDNRAAAEFAWHETAVMAAVPDNGEDNHARTILDLYLQDMERRTVTTKTVDAYAGYFKSFLTLYPVLLNPVQVESWTSLVSLFGVVYRGRVMGVMSFSRASGMIRPDVSKWGQTTDDVRRLATASPHVRTRERFLRRPGSADGVV